MSQGSCFADNMTGMLCNLRHNPTCLPLGEKGMSIPHLGSQHRSGWEKSGPWPRLVASEYPHRCVHAVTRTSTERRAILWYTHSHTHARARVCVHACTPKMHTRPHAQTYQCVHICAQYNSTLTLADQYTVIGQLWVTEHSLCTPIRHWSTV